MYLDWNPKGWDELILVKSNQNLNDTWFVMFAFYTFERFQKRLELFLTCRVVFFCSQKKIHAMLMVQLVSALYVYSQF